MTSQGRTITVMSSLVAIPLCVVVLFLQISQIKTVESNRSGVEKIVEKIDEMESTLIAPAQKNKEELLKAMAELASDVDATRREIAENSFTRSDADALIKANNLIDPRKTGDR